MGDPNRRDFLAQAGVGTAALAATTYANVQGANERVHVGIVGPGGMGMQHIRTLATQKDVRIAQLCDPDRQHLDAAVQYAAQDGHEPTTTSDMRRVYDHRDIDAVFIATPDHWHAPATLLALQAGKHVYVEKPCSHNIREGRLMLDAARRHRKVVQVGTQSRSSEHVIAAMQLIRAGAIGEVLSVRVWNSQLRRNIGRLRPSEPPEYLDYDHWVGPAPMLPHQTNRLHGVWRWWFNFGSGDMGNEGVHDLDIGRWGLGVESHPSMVTALGGKYFFDDDQEFPDTQTVIFEWPSVSPRPLGEGPGVRAEGRKKQLIFEQRTWTPYKMEGYENGDAFYGTRGMIILGKDAGWRLYGERNKELNAMQGRPNLLAHQRNFFDCIKSGNRPNADIEIGHLSASLCHLGNIATRVKRVINFDPKSEEIHNDKQAGPMVRREYREHWARPRGV